MILYNKGSVYMEFEYKCENCGACCRFWNPAKYDPTIVDKNGNCKYLDLNTKKCTIYDNRPIFCRIEAWYHANEDINKNYSYEEFIRQQKIGCDILIKLKETEDEILFIRSSAK